MYFTRLINQNDRILLRSYIKNKIYEHISMKDLVNILQCSSVDIIKECHNLWVMKTSVRLELYRRTGIVSFNNVKMNYLMEYVSEDEFLDIMRNTGIRSYVNILEKAVDKQWNNVIKYISKYNIRHEVSDENIMRKLQYAMSISPNIHISFAITEVTEDITKGPRYSLYNIDVDHEIGAYIPIPLCAKVEQYKQMLNNWSNMSKRDIKKIHSCTSGKGYRSVHHLLFLTILGFKVRSFSAYNHVINLPILDYLANKYPNTIQELLSRIPNNNTLKRLCIVYLPAYLDRVIVNDYWSKYSRMHIDRNPILSDICLITKHTNTVSNC